MENSIIMGGGGGIKIISYMFCVFNIVPKNTGFDDGT
jgi:hypothetical protein